MNESRAHDEAAEGVAVMGAWIDLRGKQFGRLTVLGMAPRTHGRARWDCICECGTRTVVTGDVLQQGRSMSCGCLRREMNCAKFRVHGAAGTPEYRAWSGMKARCHNPNNPDYHRYGDRGIRVCDRWIESFERFLADMGPRPSSEHSLDRFPNNDGNYEPDNCRWATAQEQAFNRRPRRKVQLPRKLRRHAVSA